MYFIAKSSIYYFHEKAKMLANFQICIGVPASGCYSTNVTYSNNKLFSRELKILNYDRLFGKKVFG